MYYNVVTQGGINMDFSITQLSMPINQANLQTNFGVKMLAEAMDTNKEIGQGLINMIDSAALERSVNPAVGSNFDMSV